MRTGGYVEFQTIVDHRRSRVLIKTERLVQPSLTFNQIHHGAKGQQRIRIDIRVDLISGDEERCGCACRLRCDIKKHTIMIEITLAPAHLKSRETERCIVGADEHLVVELLTDLERQVLGQRGWRFWFRSWCNDDRRSWFWYFFRRLDELGACQLGREIT